jgi:hypothetical protein
MLFMTACRESSTVYEAADGSELPLLVFEPAEGTRLAPVSVRSTARYSGAYRTLPLGIDTVDAVSVNYHQQCPNGSLRDGHRAARPPSPTAHGSAPALTSVRRCKYAYTG